MDKLAPIAIYVQSTISERLVRRELAQRQEVHCADECRCEVQLPRCFDGRTDTLNDTLLVAGKQLAVGYKSAGDEPARHY
eukprot:1157700-Prymnesium_polylepis.1